MWVGTFNVWGRVVLEEILKVVGIFGAIIYLFTYLKVQLRRDYAKSFEYSGLNFLAASFVLLSLIFHWNFPSAIIQVSWMIISLYGLYRCYKYVK